MNSATLSRKKLYGLQGVRAMAFLAIFAAHCQFSGKLEGLGAWGVSVFIVMSGFLMAYGYLQRDCDPAPGLRFAWSKVRRLYPLHIATMLACVVVGVYNVATDGSSPVLLGLNVVLNSLMLQTYVPVREVFQSLNGVSWFMAVSVLTYAVFPALIPSLRKIKSSADGAKALCALLVLEGVIAAIGSLVGGDSIGDIPSTRWIVYYFPPSRLVDFVMGCVLGRMLLLRGRADGRVACSGLHIALVLLAIATSCVAYALQVPVLGSDAVRFTLLFAPTSPVLIWLVATFEVGGGCAPRLLGSRLLVWVGDLSPYTYLIHWVVIWYVYFVFNRLAPGMTPLAACTSLAITFTLAVLWKRAARHLSHSGNV